MSLETLGLFISTPYNGFVQTVNIFQRNSVLQKSYLIPECVSTRRISKGKFLSFALTDDVNSRVLTQSFWMTPTASEM